MVKEEKNPPEWKKRVPYEKSEAAHHHEAHQKPAGHEKEMPKGMEKAKAPEAVRGMKETAADIGAKVAEKAKVPEAVRGVKEAAAGVIGAKSMEKAKAPAAAGGMRETAMSREAAKPRMPEARAPAESAAGKVCDACGKVHSPRCEIIDFAGQKFNVCGECIPAVRENPADFLAGKRGTEPESMDFDVCGTPKR